METASKSTYICTEANTAKYKNKTNKYLETYKSKYRNSHQGLFSLKHIYTSIHHLCINDFKCRTHLNVLYRLKSITGLIGMLRSELFLGITD